MLMRSVVRGALVATVFLVYQGVRDQLDVEAIVFGIVFGVLFGTFDYFMNRKRIRTHEFDKAHDNITGG